MEKEYVYVRKDIIEQIKALEEGKFTLEGVTKLFNEFKGEIETYTYDIEDAAVMFRRQAQKIKDSFKEVVDKEVEALQEFWDVQENKRAEIQTKFYEYKKYIGTIKDDINEIKTLTSDLHIYGLDKFVELAKTIANLRDNEREMLSRIFVQPSV